MTVNLSPVGGAAAQFFDNNGTPLVAGKIFTYLAGTTTPTTTYTTVAGNIAHTNPIILDSAGRVPSGGEIWVANGVGHKFLIKTSADVLIGTYDNVITGITDASLVTFVPSDPTAPVSDVQTQLRQFDFLGSSTTGVWYRAGTNYESQGTVVKQETRPFYHDYRPLTINGSPFNTDGGNMFFGFGSGNFTMMPDSAAIGDFNIQTSHNQGFGLQALGQITTGYKNVGLGTNAFRKLTQGFGNVAVGRDCGHELTTGISNSFVGFTAGFGVTTGNNNVAVGTSALNQNSTGSSNVAVGRRAGFDPTSGNLNTFIGAQSGVGQTSGSNNTFIGSQAANNGLTTAENCTVVGSLVTGLDNVDGQVVLADGAGVKYFVSNPSGTSAAFAKVVGRNSTAVDLTAADGQISSGVSLIAQNELSSNSSFSQIALQSRGGQAYGRIVYWNGTAPRMSFIVNNVEALRFNQNGDSFVKVNTSVPTVPSNEMMTYQLVSNTELKILVKGSDGTTRSVSLTLT